MNQRLKDFFRKLTGGGSPRFRGVELAEIVDANGKVRAFDPNDPRFTKPIARLVPVVVAKALEVKPLGPFSVVVDQECTALLKEDLDKFASILFIELLAQNLDIDILPHDHHLGPPASIDFIRGSRGYNSPS